MEALINHSTILNTIKLQWLEYQWLVYVADSKSFLSPWEILQKLKKTSIEGCLRMLASWPSALINPQLLKLLMSRTNFHSPKDVRAIEVRLDVVKPAFRRKILRQLLDRYVARFVSNIDVSSRDIKSCTEIWYRIGNVFLRSCSFGHESCLLNPWLL